MFNIKPGTQQVAAAPMVAPKSGWTITKVAPNAFTPSANTPSANTPSASTLSAPKPVPPRTYSKFRIC